MALQAKRYSVSTYLKFFLFSAFGVFAFFINFNLPAYQIHIGGWEWGLVKAQSNVLCSHLTNFIKAALYTGNFKAMPFVVWAIGLYAVVDLFWLRPEKAWHTNKVNAAFAIFKSSALSC
jgi:nucleoside recognition membrane protein YjiH